MAEGRAQIAVLNFGGQYAHLIRRRIRELGVSCELFPYSSDIEVIKKCGAKGIIFSGGPASVYEEGAPKPSFNISDCEIPILGICYGHQLIAHLLGGKVSHSGKREYGKAKVYLNNEETIFKGIPKEIYVWFSHSDSVVEAPERFDVIAKSEFGEKAALSYRQAKREIYSLQFHPEVSHTEHGLNILRNFVFDVARCKEEGKKRFDLPRMVEEIRKQIGDERALCAVSGGVDSTTAAVLVGKAIGERLTCLFVNHGLLRKGEAEEVLGLLKKLRLNVQYLDASSVFLNGLKGISDPEEKRMKVGALFADIFVDFAKQGNYAWLVQGTVYPDVIESSMPVGGGRIKSHHNVAALPKDLGMKVLEPLRELYKDEVRRLARILKIPDEFIERHPFPGPGLAVRVIGEVTEEKLRVCREASWIFEDELKKAGLYKSLWQAFAIVGDDRAVGVKGDNRSYGYIVTLKAVKSRDGMTASFAKLPYPLIERVSRRISNELPEVVMLTYSVSNKPPSTIEPQ